MDIEDELRKLVIDWPPLPAFKYPSAADNRRRRRSLVLAFCLTLAAVGALFAVPKSRAEILRFLHLGSVNIEVVSRLPNAEEQKLGQSLGPTVGGDAARRYLLGALLVPPGQEGQTYRLHYRSGVVSLVLSHEGHPVLLNEIALGQDAVVRKMITSLNATRQVTVRGQLGLWVTGGAHEVIFPNTSPRIAGPSLIWSTSRATYRIEGEGLGETDAIALADSLK